MTSEVFTQIVDTWVTQYVAIFCLLTILIWGGGSFLLSDKWQKSVRDAAIYFLTIGILTALLALRPTRIDVLLWAPFTWFYFSMLLVMELLWLSYLADGILRMIQSLPSRISTSLTQDHTNYPGGFQR